jgi:diacylglycerol kinase family enzyme
MPLNQTVVIVNPKKLDRPRRARGQLESLVTALGHPPPFWVETTKEDPGPGQARRAVDEGASMVLVWGGDGTVNGVIAGLAHSGVPLGILPGGTTNLLARNLGIPLSLESAVDTAYAGSDRAIDLLDVDLGHDERRVSAVMCGAGWDAEMMAASSRLKRRFGWGAYAITGARKIAKKPMHVEVSIDGGPAMELTGRSVLIANVGTLIAGLDLIPEARPDDGQLDVLVIDPSTPTDWARTGAGLILGSGSEADPSRTLLRGNQAVVRTEQDQMRQVDGDLVSRGTGFNVSVLPGAVTVRR